MDCDYHTEEKILKATGHTYEDQYISDSSYHYKVCTTCKEESKKEEHIWSEEATVIKEATCDENGLNERYCTVCSAVKEEVITYSGHNLTHFEAKDATCTSEGHKEYWFCSTCDKYFLENSEEKQITGRDDVIIAALGHNYQNEVISPTCLEEGYTLYECDRCGESYKNSYTETITHNYVVKEVVDPTCYNEGYTVKSCSMCKDEIETDYVDALGHDYNGTTTTSTCTRCGESNPAGLKMSLIYEELDYLIVFDSSGQYSMDFYEFPKGSTFTVNDGSEVELENYGENYYYAYLSSDQYETGYVVDVSNAIKTGYSVFFYNNECLDKEVNIPSTYNGLPVTKIIYTNSIYGNQQNTNMEKVNIPSSITSIENNAFSNCSSLKEIVIPDSVTSLGYSEFDQNQSGYVFSNCTNLTKVTLSKNLKEIPQYCFENCTSLKSIIIPEGVTSIGVKSFCGCTSLESIILPKSLTSIGNYAFKGCNKLSKIYFNGTSEEYSKLSVSNTSSINTSLIYYYSEENPSTSGNYWHYVNGEATSWN